MASADLRDELTCSICMDSNTDPVTLTCGHSFCKTCIEDAIEAKEGPGAYKCPECRPEFEERPALEKNVKLCNIAESVYPEQEDVGIPCTSCDSPVPAAKTGLLCEASMCENYVKKHSKSEEHDLMEPTTLENQKCPIHKEVLEYYCLEDDTCVCVSCLIGEHRGHQTESLQEAAKKKKAKIQSTFRRSMSRKKKNERKSRSLQDESRGLQDLIAGLTREITALFVGIREQLETVEKRVLSQVARCGDKISNIYPRHIKQLDVRTDELSRKVVDMKELCNKTDLLSVLQEVKSGGEDEEKFDAGYNNFAKDKNPAVQGDDDIRDEMIRLLENTSLIFATLNKGLDDLVTWATRQCNVKKVSKKFLDVDLTSNILLDINTASNNTAVSGDQKTMTFSNVHQGRPEGPERFMVPQVLSTTGFVSENHYWEVEGSPSGGWRVGVTYPSIHREGVQAVIGNNNKSWVLEMNANNQYIAIHDNQSVLLPVTPSCWRLGIFLNYTSGLLLFYELHDPIRLLHTFMTSFMEPLHIAIFARDDGWVRIRR